MPVIINGRRIDLARETTVPLTPPRAWEQARARLDAANWALEVCLDVVKTGEPRMLVLALEDTFTTRAPAEALVACVARARSVGETDQAWLEPLVKLPPHSLSALLASWANERAAVPVALLGLGQAGWASAVERIVELLRIGGLELKHRGETLRELATNGSVVTAIDAASRSTMTTTPPWVFIELLVAASPASPTGALPEWVAKARHDRTVARRLKRACFATGRRDIAALIGSPIETKTSVPKPGQVALALQALIEAIEKRAAVIARNLRPGATAEELAAVGKAFGFALPDEVNALWRLADGQRAEQYGFYGLLEFFSAKRSLEVREFPLGGAIGFLRERDADWDDAGVTDDEILSDAWVAIAGRDYDLLVVSGVSGRVFRCEKDSPPLKLLHESVAAWLTAYRQELASSDLAMQPCFGNGFCLQ